MSVENWTCEQVFEWASKLVMPSSAASIKVQDKMKENDINGHVLLKYNVDSLMQDGFTRGCAVILCEAIEELRPKSSSLSISKEPESNEKEHKIKVIPTHPKQKSPREHGNEKTLKASVKPLKFSTEFDKRTVEEHLITNTGIIDRKKERKLSDSYLSRTKAKCASFVSTQKRLDGLECLLIRHGESEANIYATKPDHAIELSAKGIEEAKEAGRKVKQYFQEFYGENPPPEWKCRAWISPFKRTRQTAKYMIENAGDWITDQREDIRLIEQQFGLFDGCDWSSGVLDNLYHNELTHYNRCHMFGGRFYARVPMGESRFDVCNRVNMLFQDMANDAKSHGIKHVVVVSHGVTTRAFLMQYLRLSPEWFEESPNPSNGSIRVIRHNQDYGYYWDPRKQHKKPSALCLNRSAQPKIQEIMDEIKKKRVNTPDPSSETTTTTDDEEVIEQSVEIVVVNEEEVTINVENNHNGENIISTSQDVLTSSGTTTAISASRSPRTFSPSDSLSGGLRGTKKNVKQSIDLLLTSSREISSNDDLNIEQYILDECNNTTPRIINETESEKEIIDKINVEIQVIKSEMNKLRMSRFTRSNVSRVYPEEDFKNF